MTTYRRVTVTIPTDVLRAADGLARRLDRSRSWVVADALRRYAGSQPPATAASSSGAVRERGVPYGAGVGFRGVIDPPAAYGADTRGAGLGEQRLAQLEADLQLTPEQRVHEAEESVELAFRLHPRPRAGQVLAFERYEDFLEWRERDLLW
jgi:hypothetical protein